MTRPLSSQEPVHLPRYEGNMAVYRAKCGIGQITDKAPTCGSPLPPRLPSPEPSVFHSTDEDTPLDRGEGEDWAGRVLAVT